MASSSVSPERLTKLNSAAEVIWSHFSRATNKNKSNKSHANLKNLKFSINNRRIGFWSTNHCNHIIKKRLKQTKTQSFCTFIVTITHFENVQYKDPLEFGPVLPTNHLHVHKKYKNVKDVFLTSYHNLPQQSLSVFCSGHEVVPQQSWAELSHLPKEKGLLAKMNHGMDQTPSVHCFL